MKTVISSPLPFAPLSWWQTVLSADELVFDEGEHFQKMSWRNRYRIFGANGPVLLSIPIVGGRSVRQKMGEVGISYDQPWMQQHWKTLTSAYRRAAYFEHYEAALYPIFSTPVARLADFNRKTFDWVAGQLGWSGTLRIAANFITDVSGSQDLRNVDLLDSGKERPYFQLFADRHGFQANLSVLDLLMSEGPYSRSFFDI